MRLTDIRNNDRVGAVLFTDRIEHVVPPRKGRRHALRLMRDLLAFEPVGSGTDITPCMDTPCPSTPHAALRDDLASCQYERSAGDLYGPASSAGRRLAGHSHGHLGIQFGSIQCRSYHGSGDHRVRGAEECVDTSKHKSDIHSHSGE